MAKLSYLASASETRKVLERHGRGTKYSLGQNFLVNDSIIQKIVALADVNEDDVILEIGPGIGTLTVALLQCAQGVTSIELDPDLPEILAETTATWADRFALIENDALAVQEADVVAALDRIEATLTRTRPNKLVANLPYQVAATVVLDYFQRFPWLESMTVMVQKEVADRMMAQQGVKDYGAFTVKLGMYARPAGRFPVGPNNFFPPPRVDSAVIRLDRSSFVDSTGAPMTDEEIGAACLMAEAGFATRRKTLANSCKTYFAGRGAAGKAFVPQLPALFEAAGIDSRRRGETLTRAEFVALGHAYLSLAAQ